MSDFEIYSDDNTNQYPDEWYISGKEFTACYEEIKAELLRGKTPVEHPKAISIGGQPASGKSGLLEFAKTTFKHENYVVLDNDLWRKNHPHYDEIKVAGKLECKPVADFIRKVRTRLVADLTEEGYNFVNHNTLGDNEVCGQLKTQKNHGYETVVMVMACNDYESRLGIFDRFIDDILLNGVARFSLRGKHDKAYLGVVNTLSQIEQEQNADEVLLYNREEIDKFRRNLNTGIDYTIKPIYHNQADGENATEVLWHERELPWSIEKYKQYKAKCEKIAIELGEIFEEGYIQPTDYKKMTDELHEMAHESMEMLDHSIRNALHNCGQDSTTIAPHEVKSTNLPKTNGIVIKRELPG